MISIKIGEKYWSVDEMTGKVGPGKDVDSSVDCSLGDVVKNENINLLMKKGSSSSLYVDEKGYLKEGFSCQTRRVREVVSATLQAAVEVAGKANDNDRKVIEHVFYHLMRDSKLKFHEKREHAGRVWWQEKRIFPKDGLVDHLDIIVGDLFWSVNRDTGLISKPLPLRERSDDVEFYNLTENSSPETIHNLQMLFLRRKGQHLFADKQGRLKKGFSGNLQKTQQVINESLAQVLYLADKVEGVAKAPLSHFLYHFMNREGSIGRLSDAVGYRGMRNRRLFNHDLMEEHVNIVIGKHYWSVNTKTKKVSKALPINERHQDIPMIDLSGNEAINDTLKQLFERSGATYFRAKNDKIEPVESLRDRISYAWHKREERERVKKVVTAAIQHLDGAVGNQDAQALKIFLRNKFQDQGPLASMKMHHFDRSAIRESGGIESHLKHGLKNAREELVAKLIILNRFPPKKMESFEIPEEKRSLVEEISQNVMSHSIFEKVRLDARRALEKAIDQDSMKEALKNNLTKLIEFMARRLVRKKAYEMQDEKIVINHLDENGDLSAEAAEIIDDAKRKIIRQEVADAQHKLLVEEFLFAQSLGIDLAVVGDGGSGGARYAFDRFGHKILVIKPDDEGPYGRNNPRWSAYLKQMFLRIRSCLAENSEPLTEKSSRQISQAFGIDIVPSTSVAKISSKQFVGSERKWCSVQAFVNGCQTMQKALGLTKGWNKYIWMFIQNCCKREKIAKRFASGGRFAENLTRAINGKDKAFQRAFARFAIHNFLIGDTDCHFDNWLMTEKKVSDKRLIGLFGEEEVGEQEIPDLVHTEFFTNSLFYQLQKLLLHAEDGLMIIKHDGGSSMPRRHPVSNFEVRLAYLFDVLPQMQEVFSEEIKSMFKDGDRTAYEAIAQVAIQNLVNSSMGSDFIAFWNRQESRKIFKEWLFTGNPKQEKTLRVRLATELAFLHDKRPRWWHWHYNTHLIRIKGMADSFIDRWAALIAHFQEKPQQEPWVMQEQALAVSNKTIKTLFGVKLDEDFERFREGHNLNPAYSQRMRILEKAFGKWVEDDVLEVAYNINTAHSELMQMSQRLAGDLG